MERSIFSTRLKYVLAMKKITQTELSKRIGVNRETISRYISGKSSPRIEDLTKIVNVLEVSSDYLLGLNDDFVRHTSATINIDHAIRKCEQLADEWKEIGDKASVDIDHGDNPSLSLHVTAYASVKEDLYRRQIPRFLKELYINPNMSIHRR